VVGLYSNELENAVRQNLHKLTFPLQLAVVQSEMQLELFDGYDSEYCFT
jgi:hypothetical protein